MGKSLRVSVNVRNTGPLFGAEVIQLYAGAIESAYDRPLKELKGFRKVSLQPGEEQCISFDLPASALSVWDGGWVVERTGYRVWVGTSSRQEDLSEASFRVI